MHSFLRKLYLIIGVFISLLLWEQKSVAQGYLQFKENKGQWNSEVLYRAQLPNGHIYLRENGITYSFLSNEDMHKLREGFHGTYDHNSNDSGFYDKGPRHQSNTNAAARISSSGSSGSQLPKVIHGHAYNVNFLHANKQAQLLTDHKSQTSYNYLIGKDQTHWGQHVSAFGGVTYKALYPNIDMHVYSNNEGLKYDLIVHPGGNYKDIQFEYEGADELYTKNNQLYIKTSVGTNVEVAPYAYQVIDNKKVDIKVKYKLKGNVLTFRPKGNYDPSYSLIIDPNFIFATYSGSSADNWGYTATYDAAGNFYMGGIVFGVGYPTTPGAFEEKFQGGGQTYGNGGFDISISKLSPDGKNLIYATYLGGSGDEQPHSFVVNDKNQLIISGRTNDGSSYPGDRVGPGGRWDMVLTELTADGSGTVGSLIIGGTGEDGVNIADKYTPVNNKTTISLRRFYGDDARSEVNVDAEGNIILVGSTQSDNFPVTSGVFQSEFGSTKEVAGVKQDAVVLKAAPDLSGVTWASYLGGNANDAAYVLAFSNNGNIYVAGGTGSSNFPGVSGQAIQSKYGGRVDGFISEVTPDGKTLLRSTYLGSDQADQIYGIQTDKEGNVYVGGTTEGDWKKVFSKNIPLKGVKYGKQFFCKFDPHFTKLIYSATFGSSNSERTSLPNISPTAFLVDRCQNVYMSGWGGNIQPQNPSEYPNQGTYGLPKVNPLNLTSPDGRDFYFITMKKNAAGILFADTYGQKGGFTDHVDGGTSRFDPNGVIYQAICANCGGGTIFPTGPPGVVSRRNGSLSSGSSNFAQCNVVGFKIAFNLDGVRGGIATKNRRSNYCFHEEITFVDTLYGRPADAWNWEVFKGDTATSVFGPEKTDTSNFTHEFTKVGTYVVRLIKHDSTACIERDTSFIRIHIGDNPAQLQATAEKLPPCKSYKYRFVNLSKSDHLNPIPDQYFTWNFDDGTGDEIQKNDSTIHQFPGQGSYTVTLSLKDTAHFCNTPIDTSFVINASDILEAKMDIPDIFCDPGVHKLNNVSLGGTNYIWVVEKPGLSDTIRVGDGRSVPYDFTTKGKYKVTLIAEDTVCQEKDKVKDSVVVYPKPTAAFNVTTDQQGHNPPVNAIFHLENVSQSNFDQIDSSLTYEWYFGDGKSSEKKNPDHLYAETGTYEITLIVTNAASCSDTIVHEVQEKVVPALDVPSAFTPGSGDINGYAAPKAFGVKEIDFSIYNRWGERVFHSNDPDISYIYQKGWDGTYKGKPQEMDAYAYVVYVVFYNGEKATKKGSITLVR